MTERMTDLRTESDRLFAEHQALARELERREPARRAELEAAKARWLAATEAEEQAWRSRDEAWMAALGDQADPALIAAHATVAAAQAETRAAWDDLTAVFQRQNDGAAAESARLIELGERFRRTQGDYLVASWPGVDER